MSKFSEFVDAAKKRFEESPETMMLAGAALFAGTAKLINATSGAQSKRAYARKMNHSIRRR